jgi:hypothetical protein
MKQPPIKFSVQEVIAICDGLLELGDESFRYADQLQSANFRAFIPRWKFAESFCTTPQEHALHRRCVVEIAKNIVGRPWPPQHTRWTAAERALLYASPLIAQLANERDKENGVPTHKLSSRYPRGEARWRHEFDPCLRRQWMAVAREPSVYKERWNTVLDEEARALEREVAQHATGISRVHAFDKDGRFALFAAIMERDATPLGFCYDKGKSRQNYPVFSKSVSKDWDVSWAIEEPDLFCLGPFQGHLTPYLEVRARTSKGRIDNLKFGESMQIRYATIVPGFYGAYRVFHTLDQLETLIKAHLCFYYLMAPTIEGALKRVLGGNDDSTIGSAESGDFRVGPVADR